MASAMSTLRSNQSELTALDASHYTTNFCVGKCDAVNFCSIGNA